MTCGVLFDLLEWMQRVTDPTSSKFTEALKYPITASTSRLRTELQRALFQCQWYGGLK